MFLAIGLTNCLDPEDAWVAGVDGEAAGVVAYVTTGCAYWAG